MSQAEPVFHVLTPAGITSGEIAEKCGGILAGASDPDRVIVGFSSAFRPVPDTLAFLRNAKDLDKNTLSALAAVLVDEKTAEALGGDANLIIVAKPHLAFAALARELFPASIGSSALFPTGDAPEYRDGALISRHAHIEDGVVVEGGAVIGDHVGIGRGTRISAQAVIAHSCQIGRNCEIGTHVSVQYALIGDGVTLHPGVRIGQEGFGFVPGSAGLEKVPQLGRVILQNNVEIGANATIDRGALEDTVIGEGTKIDNLVQIAHNVQIGRNCAIAAHTGISGSAVIGDGCLLGGRVGIADHIRVGNGVQIAAASGVMNDIPDGERWAGAPAQPIKAFFREQATLRRLAKPNKG